MRRRVDVITGDGRIEAVLGDAPSSNRAGVCAWSGALGSLKAHGAVGRLLPGGAIFDAELTERWARLVACTPEFSAWWRAHPATAAPAASFFLEVHHGG